MHRTVFVSSTFQDLQAYRRAAWEILSTFDCSIRGMEQFGARMETPLQTCMRELEQSDIYLGIIGFRHGSIEPSLCKSYTQIEYEHAHTLGKDIRIYLVDEENAKFPIKYIDKGESRDQLEAFKATLRERHTVEHFVDEQDLKVKLKRDLDHLLATKANVGDGTDEDLLAETTLKEFLLLPKLVAGREIRLRVRAEGPFFPASQSVCKAFNFEFGATVGIPVKIIQPNADSKVNYDLYVPGALAKSILQVQTGTTLEIYARLHFFDSPLENKAARFQTTQHYSAIGRDSFLRAVVGESVIKPADSAIAIELSRLIARASPKDSAA